MTEDDLFYQTQIKKNLEFKYNGKTYQLYYDKDENGNDVLMFGELFSAKPYTSFGDLMNNATVDNHFLKNMLENL